jgi:aldose 1-epimerase
LLPWPNRIAGGRYTWEGVAQQLPLDDLGTHSAIHGLTQWLAWQPVAVGTASLTLAHDLVPRPGYPFRLRLEMHYTLTARGIDVRVFARNEGDRPAPFGAGMHPYLTVGTPVVDAASLTVPATERLVLDGVGQPTGERASPPGTGLIGPAVWDDCLTGLVRGTDGRAVTRLAGPERSVELWVDECWPYLMVFTGDTLAGAARRRGVAVEPMTCPPGAFATGADLVILAPGQSFDASFGISEG